MVVGNQDSLHVAIPGCPDQLTVVGGRIDDDTLIGLGADKEIGIVVIGPALHLVYIDLLVFVVCSHRVAPFIGDRVDDQDGSVGVLIDL